MEVEVGVLQGLAANGDLFAAWKGDPDDDRIFYSSWGGSGNWAPALTIDGNTSASAIRYSEGISASGTGPRQITARSSTPLAARKASNCLR